MLPVQCKMARAALGLGVRDLAAKAGVSPDVVFRLEKGEALHQRTGIAIREALEDAVRTVRRRRGDRRYVIHGGRKIVWPESRATVE